MYKKGIKDMSIFNTRLLYYFASSLTLIPHKDLQDEKLSNEEYRTLGRMEIDHYAVLFTMVVLTFLFRYFYHMVGFSQSLFIISMFLFFFPDMLYVFFLLKDKEVH